MTLDEELAAIEERASKATPGPWDYYAAQCCPDMGGVMNSSNTKCLKAVVGQRYDHPASIEDAEFIASTRTDVPRLVAALRLAIEQRDELSEELEGNTFVLEFCKREDNAAILRALRGEE